MSIRIIPAEAFHAPDIAVIGKKSFRQAFAHLFNNSDELDIYLEKTYNTEKLAQSIRKDNNQYYLALQDDHPIGFVKMKKVSANENIKADKQMELQKIYVLPDYQKSGAGSVLMNKAIEFSHEICPDYLWLDVHVSNEKAIRFSQRNGFEMAGKRVIMVGSQNMEYRVMSLPIAMKY